MPSTVAPSANSLAILLATPRTNSLLAAAVAPNLLATNPKPVISNPAIGPAAIPATVAASLGSTPSSFRAL